MRGVLLGRHDWGAGIDIHEVFVQGSDVFVVLSYARDPLRYAIRCELQDPGDDEPDGPWTGTPVESVELWVEEVAGWLEEEFRTGFPRRAARMPGDGFIELRPRPGTDLGAVWLHSVLPGGEREVRPTPGLNADGPQQARREGRLIAWWQADDQSAARPIRGPLWLLRRWMRRNAVKWGAFVAAESIRVGAGQAPLAQFAGLKADVLLGVLRGDAAPSKR